MNRKEIVAIAVRLFAIALAVYGINNLPGMVMFFERDNSQSAAYAYAFAGVSALIFVIAILLWFFPYTVASSILPKNYSKIQPDNWNQESVLTCGLILLGIYFFYYVISDAVYWFYISRYSLSFEGSVLKLNLDDIAKIWATAVEFLVSMLLIFGSKGIANIILKMRYVGYNPSNKTN